jgi:hypothetical protein
MQIVKAEVEPCQTTFFSAADFSDLDFLGCDRAGARDYAAFLGFFSLEPS